MAEEEPHDPDNQLIPPHEVEYFDRLFKAEASFMADPGYWRTRRAATLRRYAVVCIEDYSKCESFDAFVPFLAMTYFDRLISRHKIMPLLNDEQKNEDLFVICCLTIAWKMRSKAFKLPVFLSTQKKKYDAVDVMKMELYILNQLEWRMQSLTPICFADYFISFLMPQEDQIGLTRRLVRQIIITSQADIRITRFKPSLVAASAVSAISLKRFPTQSSRFEVALSRCQYVERELSSCKEALQNICNAKLENLMSPSAEEETSSEASGSGVGTSEAAGGTSEVARGTSEVARGTSEAAGEASGSGVGTSEAAGGTSEVARGTSEATRDSSSSLQVSLPPGAKIRKKSKPMQIGGDPPGTNKLQMVKRTISSSLLKSSMPPGATADDKVGKEPVKEVQPQPQPQPTPAPSGTEDLQLDFELEWSKYQAQELLRGSLVDRLADCCPTLTTGDTDNRCLIL